MRRLVGLMAIALIVVVAVAFGPDWPFGNDFADAPHPRAASGAGVGLDGSGVSGVSGVSRGSGGAVVDEDEEWCLLERRFPGFSGVYLDDQQRPVVNFTHGVRPRVEPLMALLYRRGYFDGPLSPADVIVRRVRYDF